MLADIAAQIQSQRRFLLASASPRRSEILGKCGISFDVRPSAFEENLDKALFDHPSKYVEETARQKAKDVWKSLQDGKTEEGGAVDVSKLLVIGSDTIVTVGNTILEKPTNRDHAIAMLGSLSGKTHTVYSGVTLLWQCSDSDETEEVTFHAATHVTFSELPPAVISSYVDTKEPVDKAGGYGIQGIAGSFVSGISGCYYNVMGFPANEFCRVIRSLHDSGRLGTTTAAQSEGKE